MPSDSSQGEQSPKPTHTLHQPQRPHQAGTAVAPKEGLAPPGRWINTILQLGVGPKPERNMLVLPDTVTVLGAEIPFWYAAGGFLLVLVAICGEHPEYYAAFVFRRHRFSLRSTLLNHAGLASEAGRQRSLVRMCC